MSEFIVKEEAETDERYGKPPEKRSIKELLETGFVNLDKPGNLTSHQATKRVKELLGVEKAGHAGTLDSLWEGRS